jgi:hypothetical protein
VNGSCDRVFKQFENKGDHNCAAIPLSESRMRPLQWQANEKAPRTGTSLPKKASSTSENQSFTGLVEQAFGLQPGFSAALESDQGNAVVPGKCSGSL